MRSELLEKSLPRLISRMIELLVIGSQSNNSLENVNVEIGGRGEDPSKNFRILVESCEMLRILGI